MELTTDSTLQKWTWRHGNRLYKLKHRDENKKDWEKKPNKPPNPDLKWAAGQLHLV